MDLYTFPTAGQTIAGDEFLFQDTSATAPVWKPCTDGKEITPDFAGMIRRPQLAAIRPAVLALGEVIKIMSTGGNPAQDKTALRAWAPRAMAALQKAGPLVMDTTAPPAVSLQ
jgi:hypothetical protein